jgi:peroxiredoxin
MRTLSLGVMGLAAMAASLYGQQAQAPPHTFLKVGDVAPDFTLPSTAGGSVTLSSFRGKNNVLLAFFPAAFTGG